ncbi:acyltransferase family protein [Nitrincola sp. A-D6]|uniref:acyltransferase family protein n=1 Tax=Nitrincola sp. A-D6 TaxID=1545442 RepID=UPI001184F26D|nr:acyltransferase family protein [Nitrincola sp. A-D6]
MLYFSKESAYPGNNAVLPTIFSGLIILFSPYGLLSNILSFRPVVFLGLISYSMYLWHWPILVYSRYIFSNFDWYWFIPYIFLLTFISWLSWKYVEQVFRKKGENFKWIFAKQYVFPSLLVLIICIFYIATKGVGLYSSTNLDMTSNLNTIPQPVHRDERVCQEFLVTDALISESRCDINPNFDSKALLWGDSNAAHFVPLLAEIASETGFSFRNIAHSACPPLLSGAGEFITPQRKNDCLTSISVVRNSVNNYPVVILSAAWGFYYNKIQNYLKSILKTLYYN